jgi:uncharacterized protein
MPSPTKGVDFVLKISERCNLACTYCYFFFQKMDTFKDNTAVIKLKTVHQFVAFINQGVKELGITSINIGLHGGEPLLIKKSRFSQICQILRNGISKEISLSLMCQTNGTLIDDEWVDIFDKYNVNVGVSIDGPKHIHDKYRIDHNGKGSYEETVRGIKLLQKAAKEGRIPSTGSLCVANIDYNGEELVKHMHEDLGMHNFDLLLPREAYDSNIEDQQDKWIAYFQGVLNYWLSIKKENTLSMSTLDNIFSAFISSESAKRLDEQKSMLHNVINITSEGQIGLDDNILSLDNNLLDKSKNITNTSLKQFIASPIWQQLIKAVDEKPDGCDGCEWYRTCRGGALFNRYQKGNGFKNKTVFCKTMDYIHLTIAQYLIDRGLKVDELAERLNLTPIYIAAEGVNTTPEKIVNNEIVRVSL